MTEEQTQNIVEMTAESHAGGKAEFGTPTPVSKPPEPLDLVFWPDTFLNTKCEVVENFDNDLFHFANSLLVTMIKNGGYGIAAPQVRDNRRVIIVAADGKPIVMVNPEIVSKKGEKKFWEGCLSVPGFRTLITRAEHVVVKYKDVHGKEITLDTETLNPMESFLTPACIQHEVDHLDGITFIKYLSDLKKGMARKALAKYEHDQKRHKKQMSRL